MYVCTFMYVRLCMYVCMYVCACACMCVRVCVCVYVYVCVNRGIGVSANLLQCCFRTLQRHHVEALEVGLPVDDCGARLLYVVPAVCRVDALRDSNPSAYPLIRLF